MDQLLRIAQGRRRRATLYKYIRALGLEGAVSRVYHPKYSTQAIRSTYRLLQDEPDVRYWSSQKHQDLDQMRGQDLGHILACAEVMIGLTFLECVSGIATEHELDASEAKAFCRNRRPDGIVQLTNQFGQYEVALEVETSPKNVLRMDRLIENYLKTFQNSHYPCCGVVIVAVTPKIHRSYLRALAKVPEEWQRRFVLLGQLDLSELNPEIWGLRRKTPGIVAEKVRTSSIFTNEYLSIKSKRRDLFEPPLYPQIYEPRHQLGQIGGCSVSSWRLLHAVERRFAEEDEIEWRDRVAGLAELLYHYACQPALHSSLSLTTEAEPKHAIHRKPRRHSHG